MVGQKPPLADVSLVMVRICPIVAPKNVPEIDTGVPPEVGPFRGVTDVILGAASRTLGTKST